MPLHHPGPPPWIVNWTRPGRLLAADGITLKHLIHIIFSYQISPVNGDKMQLFFISNGNETILSLTTNGGDGSGIFDLYVNNVLDSAGYDDYRPAVVDISRYIALTQPVRSGQNIIELRVNGKNALSTNYYIAIYGASLQ